MSGPSSGSRSGDSLLYAEWTTIQATEICELNRKSVLYKLRTAINGQGVVDSVVKSLVLSFNSPSSGNVCDVGSDAAHQQQPEYLQTDRDVQWVMEVICYGLSLPITTPEQHDGVRDCVKIYCEWMSAVIPAKSTDRLIPFPIRDDPNRYFRLMIQHLYNIFVRRPSQANSGTNFSAGKVAASQQDLTANDVANRQAVLCHRILRTLETICADDDSILDNESWDGILIFLLAINDILLSGPVDREDIGTHMCDRIVKSLFDVWLISCHKCFPSPSFWKTFHDLCLRVRHRLAVIEHWNSACLSITQRLVHLSYGSTAGSTAGPTSFPVLQRMSYDVVSQTWFRFMHILGNPVDLCFPNCNATSTSRPRTASEESERPGVAVLTGLPDNFKCAMRGVSQLVNTFLGTTSATKESVQVSPQAAAHSPVVPRRPSTAQKQAPAVPKAHLPFLTSIAGRGTNQAQNHHHPAAASNQAPSLPPTPPVISLPSPSVPLTSASLIRMSSSRPKVNSILHSLGNWLFSAALIGSEFLKNPAAVPSDEDGASLSLDNNLSRRGSLGASSQGSNPSITDFEAGQAEAVGALCRLFSSKRTDEEVSPVYLARFYLVVQHGLALKDSLKPAVLTSILINSTRLFQLDLNGVNILIPHFIRALEWVTNEQRTTGPSQIELRRASVAILSSLLPYPLHFNSLPIKDCLTETTSVTTFQSLRPRLISVLINSLRTETDSTNAQHLLISLLICVQDLADHEAQKGQTASMASGDSRKERQSSEIPVTDAIASSETLHLATAYGLFTRTLHYACHNLTSNWRNDTHFSLTALEVLSALAKIRVSAGDVRVSASVQNECKKTVRAVCDYIINQCSRPPPCHVKDMHSTIVAAYQCLTIWFHEHPDFLQDRDCVGTVLEVIELGVSGSKSRTANGIVVKSEKQLKPVSMLVKDAAETLLSALMNHFGFCPPSPCPPASITGTQLLDEFSLIKYGNAVRAGPAEECVKHYRYFVNDNSILLSILKDCSGDESMVIIRSAFGKYCWSLRNQMLPLSKINAAVPDVVPRPIPAPQSLSKFKFACKYFPDSVDRIPLTKLDIIVPTLDSVVNSSPQRKQEDERQRHLLQRQAQLEIEAQKKISARNQLTRPQECREPMPSNSLEPVRLILTHCGLLHDRSCFEPNPETHLTPIVAIDHNHADLWNHLKTLDLISTRTSDTVFVYYMRKGRSDPQEILNSVSSKHYVTQVFMDFLYSLGDVIDVKKHTGWTGNVSSSWKTEQESSLSDDFGDPGLDHGGCAFDGQRKAIYWADVSHELVFVVPSGRYVEDEITAMDGEQRRRTNTEAMSTGGRSMSSDEGTSVSSRSYSDTRSRSSLRNKFKQLSLMSNIGCDTKVLVLWLESADDATDVPIECLLSTTRTGGDNESLRDYFALLVHPLKNGLFRISTATSTGRNASINPLLDGVIINRRTLGTFVRMTTLNYCRRRRLDAESFQPPHVKRRLKIQDIATKFHSPLNQSDFFTSIFV